MNNCAQCHEVGSEIGGQKCLTCHTEIRNAVMAKRGYHFTVRSRKCVECHKEHLGRDAQTLLFDRKTFDHSLTGFIQTGKHAAVQCEGCHNRKNIKSAEPFRSLTTSDRQTFLGLSSACVSCHEDRHRQTVGVECQSCHTTAGWKPAGAFDHAKTKFVLAGKHGDVPCGKCHEELAREQRPTPLVFSTKEAKDCAPCHASPHSTKFADKTCTSCHSAQGWAFVRAQAFDHSRTAFPLLGKHASVKCEQCHKEAPGPRKGVTLRLTFSKCTDCHADYHRGEFAERYGGDCARCHSAEGFTPANFTTAMHTQGRFSLSGAHAAIPCTKCHVKGPDARPVFRFASVRCDACHQDRHGGQFKTLTADASCGTCHSTASWKIRAFDHSKTAFPLVGKHLNTRCDGCHKGEQAGSPAIVMYRGVDTKCASCHKDSHAGQFAASGETSCSVCHVPEGWQKLVFDHGTQSTFPLTGGHKALPCHSCHKEEQQGRVTFVRFKPLSARCQSCHEKEG